MSGPIDADEAEELVKKALSLSPDDGYITDSLGWIFYKKGLFEEAVTYLKKATELAPDDPTILEHLGDAYVKANDKDKAIQYYRKAMEKKEKDKTKYSSVSHYSFANTPKKHSINTKIATIPASSMTTL